MKRCGRCQEQKHESEFNRNKAQRDGLNGYCRPCQKAYKGTKKYKDKRNAGRRANYCPDRNRESLVKYKYGITLEQDKQLRSAGCAVCGTYDNLAIDHCHQTGVVRGCLCGNCNRALGLLSDDFERILRLADYLNENSQGNTLVYSQEVL